jgi:hypothetical protein
MKKAIALTSLGTILLFLMFMYILFILSSCASSERIQQKKCSKALARYEASAYRHGCPLWPVTDTVEKTIFVTERHDTTINTYIAGDTIFRIDTVVNGISQNPNPRLDTEFAYSIAYIKDGILHHILVQKETVIKTVIKDAIQKTSKTSYITITKKITITVNKLTQLQLFQLWIARFSLFFLVVFLGYKYEKKYLKRII